MDQFPFHATESEKRIIRELRSIARARETTLPDAASFSAAAEYIARVRELLFPEECKLLERRENLLKALNAGALRVHFDQSLETPALTMQVKIRTAAEYAAMLERLKAFDFDAWLKHCESERANAD